MTMRLFCIFSPLPFPLPQESQFFPVRRQAPGASDTAQCAWEKMASSRAAAGPVFTCCRLMGPAWQLGCAWRVISQRLSNILYLFFLDHFQSSTPISCFCFMLSRARGLERYFLSSFGGDEGRSGAQAAGDSGSGSDRASRCRRNVPRIR